MDLLTQKLRQPQKFPQNFFPFLSESLVMYMYGGINAGVVLLNIKVHVHNYTLMFSRTAIATTVATTGSTGARASCGG